MSHQRIPANWTIQRSTPFFTTKNVPDALLTHHNTAEATEPEVKVVIKAGQFATSPPEYWHRIELSPDAQFNLNFWSEKDKTGQAMFNKK